jgi:hypothetical protein
MGNTEKNISIIAGQTISFQGGYTAGTDILEVKYILDGREYHAHTKDYKNFSFGLMGHVDFIDKGYVRYRYSEMLGEFTPSYFPPDGKITIEITSKYFSKKVTHKLNIKVSLCEIEKNSTPHNPSWKNVLLPQNVEYFYIPTEDSNQNHRKIQWYYQLPLDKKWSAIENSNGSAPSSSDPIIQTLIFSRVTENVLLVSGILNKPVNSKNGLKFRAVFSDEVNQVLEITPTTTISFSDQPQHAINPVGYSIVNGKIDTTQELSWAGIKMPHSPYFSHQSEANMGAIGKQNAARRTSRGIIGADDRIRIQDPTYFPYRAIGSLKVSVSYEDTHGNLLSDVY